MGMGSRQSFLNAIARHAEAFGEPLTDSEKVALEKMKRPELARQLSRLQARAYRMGIIVY